MLIANLALGALMVVLTSAVHFFGLALLIALVRRRVSHRSSPLSIMRQGGGVMVVIFMLFLLHTIEIWMYAALYLLIGAFDALEPALYFSTSTFTTVGFGDIVLDTDWRMLAAIESANGFLLIGWSTAYLVSVIGMIRDMDRELNSLRIAAREAIDRAAAETDRDQ